MFDKNCCISLTFLKFCWNGSGIGKLKMDAKNCFAVYFKSYSAVLAMKSYKSFDIKKIFILKASYFL